MKTSIASALIHLRNMKSRVKQISEDIVSSVMHMEDTAPEFDYKELCLKRQRYEEQIRILKTEIQGANVAVSGRFQGEELSLAHMILLNADLRSWLATYDLIGRHSADNRYRSKDDIKSVFSEGADKKSTRMNYIVVENKKNELDRIISELNQTRFDFTIFENM